jgi:uncharacterized protein involved in exopolysaccharide biosynthesis
MRDYLRMVFRRGRVLFLPVFFSALLIPPLLMIIPPKYLATTLIKRKDLAIVSNASGQLMARGGPSVSLNTLREEILTWPSLDRVIRELKIDVDLKNPRQLQQKYEELRKSITFKAVANAPGVDFVQISVVSRTPQLAQEIANKVADNYVEGSRQSSRVDIQSAVQFFREGVDDSLGKLRQTERDLDIFAKEHYADLPEVKKGYIGRLEALRTNETTHSLLFTAAKDRLSEIESQIKNVEITITSEVTSEENPANLQLENELIQRSKALESTLLQKTPEHPDVVDLKAQIETIKQQLAEMPKRVPGMEREIRNPIYQQLMMDRLSVKQEIRSEQAALRELAAQIIAVEEKVQKVVQEEKHYGDMVRARSEYEELYNNYRHSLTATQNRLQAETGSYGTQVEMISRALKPAEPYREMDIQMALSVLVGGLCVGIGLMFLLEFSDHSLRSADDAAASLEIPILCSLTTIDEAGASGSAKRLTALFVFLGIAIGAGLVLTVWSLKTYWPAVFQSVQGLF